MVRMLCLVVLALSVTASAQAASFTFTNFTHSGSDGVDWVVTIDDNTPGVFTVNVSNPATGFIGDISGIGGSITGITSAVTISDITPTGAFGGVSLLQGDEVFGGANFAGGTPNVPTFDFLIDYAEPPGNPFLSSVTFTVSTLGGALTLDDWTAFGVRGRSVGDAPDGGNGSSKDWTRDRTPVIPVPSSLAMFFGMSGVVGLMKWKRVA